MNALANPWAEEESTTVVSKVTWAKILKLRQVVPVAPVADPRLPSNVKAHSERVLTPAERGAKMTPARASALRKLSYAHCGCRLCALALNPPLTFADAERFSYGAPDAWPPRETARKAERGSALSVVRR